LSDFNQSLIFSADFQNFSPTSKFFKTRPVGLSFACGPPDRQTEGQDEANSHFSHMPKNERKSKTLKNW
jgi:hypothetical protein